jgi:protein phosphatase
MATTIVACQVQRNHYEIVWVGDSRAYLIDQNGISQLTSDHNVANALVDQGVLSHADAQRHPGQYELTQALGHMSNDKPSLCLGELHDGEWLVLCTDGLSGVISDQMIHRIVKMAVSLPDACQELLSAVLGAGAPDNVSFILLRYREERSCIRSSDFDDHRSFRLPFDSSRYFEHARSRPWLIVMIFAALVFLGWMF